MLDFELYSIYTEDNEYNGSNKEMFMSYEEAFNNRMKYANWYRPNGDVWIHRYDKSGCREIESWDIAEDGSIRNHYDWRRNEK